MLTEFCVCGTDTATLEDEARRYQGKFVESNFHHYEFSRALKTVKGYDAYQQSGDRRKGGWTARSRASWQGRAGARRQDPARTRGATEAAGRLRDERRLPLRRHALRCCERG